MGGAVSTGKDNDDLADKLAEGNYIKSVLVETLFRAVDRGHYFLPDHIEQAYRDTAWRSGNIHMSAPCIYSEVLEALELRPGLSFLNLGSGTGYLSTMVGLALGPYAINHGIELHPDVVSYAASRLTAFVQNSECYDEFDDLCQPIFVVGNCLLCSSRRRYDRIYCGAACPENQLGKIKSLLKPGGILVVPVSDRLVQLRLADDGVTWSQRDRMPVSFASLITPKISDAPNQLPDLDNSSDSDASSFEPPQLGASTISPGVRDRVPVLPDFIPPSLQQACRFVIRRHIRNMITSSHPELLARRLFDREDYKRKHEERAARENEEHDDENVSANEERQRPRRRRTRYLSIGNNFGVVIISENGSSSEDEDGDDLEGGGGGQEGEEEGHEPATESATEQSASSGQSTAVANERNEASGGAGVANEGEAQRVRPQMPHLLRFLLEARRHTESRQMRVDPQAENELAQEERGEIFANSRRRRRVSSNASASATDDVKKAKENGSSADQSPDQGSRIESTGRRMSRHLHERVHDLQLPNSLEAFLLHYRPTPPEKAPETVEDAPPVNDDEPLP